MVWIKSQWPLALKPWTEHGRIWKSMFHPRSQQRMQPAKRWILRCGIGFTAGCGAATVKEMCGQPCQLCFTETDIAANQLPKRPAPLTAAWPCLPLFLADFTFLSVCGLLCVWTYGNLSRQEISHRTQHEAPDPWKAPSSPYWPSNSGLACTAPTDLELRRARSREDLNCHSLENHGKHMKTFKSWIWQEPISWENSPFLPSFTLRSARAWWPNTCINYSSWSSWETDE